MERKLIFDEVKFDQLKSDLHCDRHEDFQKKVEDVFGFSHLSSEVKSLMHYQAYDRGHSAGYLEVLNEYHDIVDLVSRVLENVGDD